MRTIGGVYNLVADPKWQDAQAKAPYKYRRRRRRRAQGRHSLLTAMNQALDEMDADGVARGDLEEIWRVGRIAQPRKRCMTQIDGAVDYRGRAIIGLRCPLYDGRQRPRRARGRPLIDSRQRGIRGS